MDWNLCVICQNDTGEPLRCPLHAHTYNIEQYQTFLDNVKHFKILNALPVDLKIDLTDYTSDDLSSNSAKWHKPCHLKFCSTKLKKAKEKYQQRGANNNGGVEIPCPRPPKRQSTDTSSRKFSVCIFCDETAGDLHCFSTMKSNANMRKIATELGKFDLLAKISQGDLIAIEAKYHMKCLTNLRNEYRSLIRQTKRESLDSQDDEKVNESRAFVELVAYVESSVESGTQFFVLKELHDMYAKRLDDLDVKKQVNRFRLKNKLLEHFEEAQEQSDGKKTVIVFNNGLECALKEMLKERDFLDDIEVLAKAAKIIRKDMFCHNGFTFTGSFQPDCQDTSVPASLKSLISMILNGINLKEQNIGESQPCLTICQTILFNGKKRASASLRHSADREPPLPIYIGMTIHSLTRCKSLITKLYQLGLSVSYDRVMEIEDWLANAIAERHREDGCVSPPCLKKGLFSVGALDNLDHNPSSTTAKTSFHGTGISIFQFESEDNAGEIQPPLIVPPPNSQSKDYSLPDSFAIVPPLQLNTTTTSIPEREMEDISGVLENAKCKEEQWIKHASQKLNGGSDDIVAEDAITWSAYHSSELQNDKNPPSLSGLLPLFYEKAATPAMIQHGMNVLRQTVQYLNPGQIPVIALDQPLFALAKMVQWKWPDNYGENKYVVMFGGLHLEMGLWNVLGDLLESSGWTTAIIEAEIATSGVAESFLKVSHLTRTR